MNLHADTETRNIREVARALLREMEQTGHICLHAEDWGKLKTSLDVHCDEIKGMRGDIRELREDMACIRGERRILSAIIGFAGAIVGGVVTAFVGRN